MSYLHVFNFWFKEIKPMKWWVKDPDFDREISVKFKEIHHKANQGELAHWRKSPQGRLAEIIVLDQFSRNMYRDSFKAFASDNIALILAQEAISVGADKELEPIETSFMYMPCMHSESLVIHEQAVLLYEANGIANNLEFEMKHKEIIERFGRYPHRNALLNRISTPEEVEFLTLPNSSF
jgi:uncharacterized protein (DUF924 family)